MILINLTGIKAYGAIEHWLSVLKVITILMFVVCGILIYAGAIGDVAYGLKSRSYGGVSFVGRIFAVVVTFVSYGALCTFCVFSERVIYGGSYNKAETINTEFITYSFLVTKKMPTIPPHFPCLSLPHFLF